ncbi:MAG: hypothetical protein RJA44_2745 [Pseudomonadota bacterium]
MKLDPRAAATLRREFSDWKLWLTRALVMLSASAAGLVVVAFTRLSELALSRFHALHAQWWWAPLLWTPLCCAAIVWVTRRHFVGAAGSGIPQVMAAMDTAVEPGERGLYVSLRLSLAKIVLTSWGLLAGLSLGREGPSVQVAAGVMHAVRRWLPQRSIMTEHGLLVAGGAAGIAAAFNTPLAGVMFAIEELSRRMEQRSSGLLIAGIVLAGLMAVSIEGNSTYFGVIRVSSPDLSMLGPGLLVAIGSGVLGGLFARLLIVSLNGQSTDRCSRWRAEHPVRFAAGCGLAIALIGVISQGSTFGSGYGATRAMLNGDESASPFYVLLRFVVTWLTAWSGVPGGIFAPALAIGAALGHDVALLTAHPEGGALIALGMAGFLAAVTRAPLTSFIIVMEMVDGHAMVLSLMACTLVSSALARTLTRPLYATLAQVQLRRLPPRPRSGD